MYRQETLLEFRAGKMLLEGKRVITDTHKGLICIARGEERLVHFQWLDRTQNVIEDSWKLDCSNLGAEAISDVTSSSGPVKLEDLQRILCSIGPAEIAGGPDGGDFLFFTIFNGAL
ncbi:hypothetical protein V6N12_068241 [Hibiscus sabdariffa]|uniref:Pru domain-containing protein n=1 Tax=Hibiscus sabdariffa TaxID=183260 RepID=A0ABR2FPE0_9ROSI